MSERRSLMVVGNGMVGLEFCVQAAKRGLNIRYQITVFGDEPRPAYDRIRLTECMNGTASSELLLRDRQWYADQGIELVTGHHIAAIDHSRHEVRCDDGSTHSWDTLVLATGSRPFVPPIPGATLPGVFTYRTVEDIAAIRTACEAGRCGVIIGGGLLGLELAKAVREHGITTTVVEAAPGLMIRQLNPVASQILHQQISDLDIDVRLDTRTTCITQGIDRLEVHYQDGALDEADFVVIAAGIRPRDDLARDAEIRCNPRGGIIIDDHLATSETDVYAIGECAIHEGQVYGLAAPGYAMAEALAKHLNGGRLASFTGFDLSTKLKLAGLDVWTIGDYQGDGDPISWRRGSTYRQVIVRDGRLIGATVIGACREIALLQDGVGRRIAVSPAQLKKLRRTGDLFSDDLDDPRYWPEQALVCNCQQVTRGTLSAACVSGCSTIEELGVETGAGTVCGSCKPLLAQLVGAPVPEEALRQSGSGLLKMTSIAAAVLAVPFLLFEIPYSTSVKQSWDILWRDEILRQVTGFTVLGFAALAAFLSVRKRLLNIGNYGWWRALHGAIGVATLIALAVHTGLRLGANLNLALSLTFLGLAGLGAGAGYLTAIENRVGGTRIRVIRLWWARAHTALVWLVTPLLVFHIAKAYGY